MILSPVGRLKMNKRFNLDLSLEQRTLSAQDIVEVVRCLVGSEGWEGRCG